MTEYFKTPSKVSDINKTPQDTTEKCSSLNKINLNKK